MKNRKVFRSLSRSGGAAQRLLRYLTRCNCCLEEAKKLLLEVVFFVMECIVFGSEVRERNLVFKCARAYHL